MQPIFCAILVRAVKGPRKKAHVLLTHAPLATLALLNAGGGTSRDLAHAAPYLRLRCACGPFAYYATAARFAHALVCDMRRLDTMCTRAGVLARAYGVRCYSSDRLPAGGVGAYLARIEAPPAYRSACTQLETLLARLRPALSPTEGGEMGEEDI